MGYKIIVLWVLSGVLAQLIKFVIAYLREKRVDLRRLIEPGGMPSSHSAGASALTTAIGLVYGFDSPSFVIATFFSAVIIYEATGLRRSVGEQAEILNRLLDELFEGKKFTDTKLQVVLGHTPLEVILGVVMGISFALAFIG